MVIKICEENQGEEKFSFENFDHVTHINPEILSWGIDMHRMNVRNIWRILEENNAQNTK